MINHMKQHIKTQTADVVIRQFESQVDLYSKHDEKVNSPIVPFFAKNVSKIKHNPIRICEFGGGGGDLLRAVKEVTKRKLNLTNAELVSAYADHQADKSIRFEEKSILDSGYSDNRFDVVMVRNVIHHLVGTTLSQTRQNQRLAINELMRATRPGGFVLIDEQVNCSALACTVFYFLSKIASAFGISIEAYQVTPNTVVGYLTRRELQSFVAQVLPQSKWCADTFSRWTPAWQWKLTMLMNETGTAFLALQKPSHDSNVRRSAVSHELRKAS